MQRPTDEEGSDARRFQSPKKRQFAGDVTFEPDDDMERQLTASPEALLQSQDQDPSVHAEKSHASDSIPTLPNRPVFTPSAGPSRATTESPATGKGWSFKKILPQRFRKEKTPRMMSYEEAVEQAAKYQEFLPLWHELAIMIRQYYRRFDWLPPYDPHLIIIGMKRVIDKLDITRRQIDIKLDWVKDLPGTKLSYEVKKVQDRVQEILNDLNERTLQMLEEISQKDSEIEKLSEELAYNKKLVQQVKFGQLSVNKRTVAHLRAVVVEKEVATQVLQRQVDQLREENLALEKKNLLLEAKVAVFGVRTAEEYAEIIKELKFWGTESLYQFALERMTKLTDEREECLKSVTEDVIQGLKVAFEAVKDEIEGMRNASKYLEEEYARRYVGVQSLNYRCDDLSNEGIILEGIVRHREELNRSLESEISALESHHEFLSGVNRTSSPKGLQSSFASPERPRFGTPGPRVEPEDVLAQSLSLDESGPVPFIPPTFAGTPPSPMRSPTVFSPFARISPEMQSLSEPHSRIIIDPSIQDMSILDEIQPLSEPQSRMTIDPSTQNIIGVTNRLDVGRALNMQMIHSGSPSPYHQVTRVDSVISPQPGPSRMLDSPLHVQHRANVVPFGYKTPWISTQSRYGYTDPSYKMLNIPPGNFIEMNTALKKKLMLTSPQRDEPLLVNIGVDPKPLVQTESGEHFICDISLDVQQAGKSKPPRISPVYTFDQPPAITPTIDRRQGPFTPTGIFKKGHLNLRRIEDHFDDSPGRYFQPHYLPHDGRSPVSNLSPVSLLPNRTISWERIPGQEFPVIRGPLWYPGYVPSPQTESSIEESPVIKGIIDISSTDYSDSSFERSPPSPRLDRTFERSPSPVIKGPSWKRRGYTQPPLTDSSLEEESPVIRGVVDLSSTDYSESSFERTPPSPRTSERSPSPVIRGIVDMSSSPSTGGSFERSASPLMSRSPSPFSDGSFDGSPARLYGSMDPLNRVNRFMVNSQGNLDMISPASTVDGRISASPRTFERSLSPGTSGSYSRSPSPFSDGSFDGSPARLYGSTDPLNRVNRFMVDSQGNLDMISPASTVDRRGIRSASPRTFESSLSPGTSGSYSRSPSPRFDGSFGRSSSPLSQTTDGSFDRSASSYRSSTSGSFPRSPSPLNRVHRFRGDERGYWDMRLPLPSDRSYGRSASPLSNRTSGSDGQPLDTSYDSHVGRFVHDDPFYDGMLAQSYDSHMYGPSESELSRSMPSGGSFGQSMSPRTFNSGMSSSGYINPFNPNSSVLSPSGLSPHMLDSSMPPRLGGLFNENPTRLTRTV